MSSGSGPRAGRLRSTSSSLHYAAAPEDRIETAHVFAGDDRLIVEYVREELLDTVPRRLRTFLLHVSVLDEMDADACDAILERSDSARILADATRSMPLLTPIDRSNRFFRMHQLLRDSLRSLLSRQDPELSVQLHVAAPLVGTRRWASSITRCNICCSLTIPMRSTGPSGARHPYSWRPGARRQSVDGSNPSAPSNEPTRPALAVIQAWCALTDGDMASLGYWTSVASDMDERLVLPDGNSVAAAAALLRGSSKVLGGGLDRTRANAGSRTTWIAFGARFERSPGTSRGRRSVSRDDGTRRSRAGGGRRLSVPLPAGCAFLAPHPRQRRRHQQDRQSHPAPRRKCDRRSDCARFMSQVMPHRRSKNCSSTLCAPNTSCPFMVNCAC